MNDRQSGSQGGERPGVLENISTTQMEELERQFEEGDQEGWSSEQAQELWGWFGQRSGESSQG